MDMSLRTGPIRHRLHGHDAGRAGGQARGVHGGPLLGAGVRRRAGRGVLLATPPAGHEVTDEGRMAGAPKARWSAGSPG